MFKGKIDSGKITFETCYLLVRSQTGRELYVDFYFNKNTKQERLWAGELQLWAIRGIAPNTYAHTVANQSALQGAVLGLESGSAPATIYLCQVP